MSGTLQRPWYRFRVGIFALVIVTAIHVMAWLALCTTLLFDELTRSGRSQVSQRVLSVELIAPRSLLQSPAPGASTVVTEVRASAKSTRRGSPVLSRPNASPISSPKNVDATSYGESHAVIAPSVSAHDVDWQSDIKSIGSIPSAGKGLAPLGKSDASSDVKTSNDSMAATFGREVSKAARIDCRNAYSKRGLLAIPSLAFDAVRDTGCKW
ncbi:hypothetical protein H0X90_34565 [Burkholderia sp. 9775_39]|uniref:hypothetical protein n=1 Tax=unclassified Burkholderia TaxID=2613784 RepID=UPI0018C3CFC4|nr:MULTISPECIES: hypothetical protein [unclassified Burkholderia]MBG0881927.1 hypothetical protein [Burkholderia sp. 9775_39]MBG0888854.1 hypothetical protein [Burkholderia sp. 9773_38]